MGLLLLILSQMCCMLHNNSLRSQSFVWRASTCRAAAEIHLLLNCCRGGPRPFQEAWLLLLWRRRHSQDGAWGCSCR